MTIQDQLSYIRTCVNQMHDWNHSSSTSCHLVFMFLWYKSLRMQNFRCFIELQIGFYNEPVVVNTPMFQFICFSSLYNNHLLQYADNIIGGLYGLNCGLSKMLFCFAILCF